MWAEPVSFPRPDDGDAGVPCVQPAVWAAGRHVSSLSLLLLSWCFTSTVPVRLIRDGRMEVGGRGRLYTYRHTVTPRMTPALRRAAMRATLMCFINREGQSYKTMSTNHNLLEQKGQPKRNRAEALLLTRITPYR